jgi:hypothetical protein
MNDTTHPTPDAQRILVLPNGLGIAENLADRVRLQVLHRIPDLKRDRSYFLKTICGPEFWSTLDRSDAIKAGRCIAYLVATDQLPLVFDCCPHKSNKRYWLKQLFIPGQSAIPFFKTYRN